ncbi:MAG: branched-chain amino acid ABC transporter substrate-binding protein [Candidatus Eremiobacteraeota bacterium]|nr:branched-chain amino acid ABC transporter substrate-binding protein [Candidatus Eremiobacteraeota bacterium]MBV8667645.1 branched-chain amino acid ABC transporter substrate-binding protein [Candidatus Eremiobacteraeota bacterium]
MPSPRTAQRMLAILGLLALLFIVPRSAIGAGEEFPPYAKQVQIAVVAPLSGPLRQMGWDLSAGVQAAIDDANQARGLTDFAWSMTSFDDQGDPGIAEQQAQFVLVDTKNAIVIGHLGGQETFLALHVYHEAGIPIIIPTASLGALTQQGYSDVFRVCAPDTMEGALAARYAERNLKPAKVGVIWEQNDYGNDTATSFSNYAASGSNGFKTTDYTIDVDLKDLKAMVAKIAADQPDLLYVTGRGDLMAQVIEAVRKAGVTAQVIGTSTFYSDSLLTDKAFKTAADGMIVGTCVPPVQFIPSAQQFQTRFQQKNGRLSAYALFGYVAAQIAIDAAVQGRSADKNSLIRQLDAGVFPTVIGQISFRANGDPSEPNLYFYKVESGTFKYIGSALPNPAVLR